VGELEARSPCDGLLPITRGGWTLSEVDTGRITSIAPFAGQEAALSGALQTAYGLGFPEPGHSAEEDGARILWSGRRQAFLLGPEPDAALARHAAVTDQSDGWAALHLSGAGCEAVLARLVPLDLRAEVFAPGCTARSLLQHCHVSVTRLDDTGFLILGYRSMAGTLVHDLDTAMSSLAARSGA